MKSKRLDEAYLKKVQEQGLKIKGFGILYFESDIDDQLIFDTIEKISPKIRVYGSDAVKEHFAK